MLINVMLVMSYTECVIHLNSVLSVMFPPTYNSKTHEYYFQVFEVLCVLGIDGLIPRFLVVFKYLFTSQVFKKYLVKLQHYSRRHIVGILCVS